MLPPGRSRLRAVAADHFVVPARRYRRAMIEIELALVLGRDVERPFRSVAEFRSAVSAVALAVEMPDLGFESSDFSGHDLIASNVALHHFFIGVPPRRRQLGDRRRARRDGRELAAGAGAMGSQWRAGMWLANRALAVWTENPIKSHQSAMIIRSCRIPSVGAENCTIHIALMVFSFMLSPNL